MLKIAYHTLGCKVNQYETEKTREALEAAGFETTPFGSPADAYIINTCSVTSVADSKSRAAVRRALKLNPDAYVIVSGCYAELEPARIEAIEGVDLVAPNVEKGAIAERVIAHFGIDGHPTPCGPPSQGGQDYVRPRTRTRAVVKVQDGCDQFCSYCVIPYARSKKMSRPIAEVMAELLALAEFGYKEIVLAAIRLGSYEDGPARLSDLIREAARIDGIERIRLSSIEPWEVDDRLLDAMDNPRVCRHLHIPLQSGDDSVLRRMNRPYDSAKYRETAARARQRLPGIGITTDVIVGFPGETDEEFANTCAMIESIGFSRLHVFRYSARDRTKAAGMPEQVDPEVKKRRAEKLIELGTLAMSRFASSMIGRTVQVLAESRAKLPKHVTGFADNYVEVTFPSSSSLAGEIVCVRVTGVDHDGGAIGEIA